MRICWYTILLTASLSTAALAHVFSNRIHNISQELSEYYSGLTASIGLSNSSGAAAASSGLNIPSEAAVSGLNIPSGTAASSGLNNPSGPAAPASGIKRESPRTNAPLPTDHSSPQPAGPVPDSNNFSGVLFIGDSRTAGLSEYGNLGNAEVFANSGMSVYRLFDAKVTMKDQNKQSLEQVLSQNQYHTIYIMLGINELGYDYQRTVAQYRSAVARIQVMQPKARLVLEANLHVTQEKSDNSPTYSNAKINAMNQAIKQLAEDSHLYYIDVNKLFDDGNGNLNTAYTSDGSHVLGKYYSMWADWIRNGGQT